MTQNKACIPSAYCVCAFCFKFWFVIWARSHMFLSALFGFVKKLWQSVEFGLTRMKRILSGEYYWYTETCMPRSGDYELRRYWGFPIIMNSYIIGKNKEALFMKQRESLKLIITLIKNFLREAIFFGNKLYVNLSIRIGIRIIDSSGPSFLFQCNMGWNKINVGYKW